MRLRQIEVFYHVYRAGSISGAARDLHVSQPSVSKVLRHAEDQLGIVLFLRSKGRLIPTQAAHELFVEAEDIYARLSTFNGALENLNRRRGGHLRLGVLPSLSLSLGPEIIYRLFATDPLLSFDLTTLHSSEMAQALLEKKIDLCIGFEKPNDQRISCQQIGEGQLVLVSGESITLKGRVIGIEAIDKAAVIGMRESGPLARMVYKELKSRAIEPNEIGSAHTYHVALALVRKRLGLTITDVFTAYSQLGAGLHRYVLEDMPSFTIQALALADHPDPDLIARAISAAHEAVDELKSGIARMDFPKP